MDTPNIFTENTDLNIIKSWLCNSTDGQTYSINNRFFTRFDVPPSLEWDFCGIETEWDEIIGWKHDYKVDDPKLDAKAREILDNINAFIKKVNAKPHKYFKESATSEQNVLDKVFKACMAGEGIGAVEMGNGCVFVNINGDTFCLTLEKYED